MIRFDSSNGDVVIDFEVGAITLRPPKYGHLKRIRRERDNLLSVVNSKTLELSDITPLPAGPTDEQGKPRPPTLEERRAREVILQEHRERIQQIEDINLESVESFWRFVLLGASDGSCVGLASPPPPEDSDEWPAELLFDTKDGVVIDTPAGKVNLTLDADQELQFESETLIDKVLKHWGKVRSRSGPTPPSPPTPTT